MRERTEIRLKREVQAVEAILLATLDSFGTYVVLDTRDDVHQELKKHIVKKLGKYKNRSYSLDIYN